MSLTPEEAALVGASDMPSLLGMSPWGGQVALWARIVHGVQGETTEAMEEGTLAEPYIRSLYQRRTGYALLGPAKWRHPLYPWLRCSPDDRAVTPERRVLELKKYHPKDWGPEGSDAVPLSVWTQVQVQLGVGLDNGELDQDAGDVAALIRGDLRLYSVPFQPEAYERCLSAGERFWTDFVVPRRLPEGPNMRLLERDVAAIHTLYPAPTLTDPLAWDALSAQQQAVVRRWLEANKARRAWETAEDELAGKVAMLLREAPGLTLPTELGRRVDYKATEPQQRTQWEAVAADMKAMAHGYYSALGMSDADVRAERAFNEAVARHTKEGRSRPLRAW